MRSAAGAFFACKHANITRAVTEKRKRLLVKAGEHQLALAAVGKNLAGVGVDNLYIEVILVDVHAPLLGTFKRDAGTADLCQAVDVIRLDAEALFDAAAHFLCPGLGAEDAGFELVVGGLVAFFGERFADVGSIRGCAAENGGVEIHHKLNLSVCIAGGHGQRQAADLVGAAVESGAAGKESVAVANLHNILATTRLPVVPEVDWILTQFLRSVPRSP